MIKKKKIKGKVGLALGGGAARGWAHIGVIEALLRRGIAVDCVAGTSMGALVGAVYASGRIRELKGFASNFDWKQMFHFLDVIMPRSGLIDGKKVEEFVSSLIKEELIEDMKIPFMAVATDLATGDEVAIGEGNTIEAIRASISIPGIFTPFEKDGMMLADGGLVNPVPVNVARSMGADFVIAVDVNHYLTANNAAVVNGGVKSNEEGAALSSESGRARGAGGIASTYVNGESGKMSKVSRLLDEKLGSIDIPSFEQIKRWIVGEPQLPNIFDVLTASVAIVEHQISNMRLAANPPEVLIRPRLGDMKFLEFHRADEAIKEGELRCEEAMAPYL